MANRLTSAKDEQRSMTRPAKQLGLVRVWQDGDVWRFVPVGKWAPEEAELGRRLREGDEELIQIDRDGSMETIRGAVKGMSPG